MGKRTNTASWTGKMWRIDVQKDGVRKSFYSSTSGRTGQREANAKADAWLDDGIANATAKTSTVYSEFLESVKEASGESNYLQHKKYGEYYILPVCENTQIGALTEGQLQDVIDKSYKHGCLKKVRQKPSINRNLSRKTLKTIKAIECEFLKWCRKHKYTMLCPDDLKIPKGAIEREKHVLQPGSLKTLFTVDEVTRWRHREFDDYIYAYRFAVSTGMRPGEIVGVWIGDIKGNVVNLRRAKNVLNEITSGKNDNAKRSFVMNEQAQKAYNDQIELLKSQGIRMNYNTPLFQIPTERSFYNRWKAYQKKNGIPYTTLYEMRHTFVTVNGSIPDGHLKKLVGHSRSMDSRGVYDHLLNGEMEQIAEETSEQFRKILG
ncbi:MAG: tyrosine-type recombinase/integrase [Faecalibacterium sp.]|jgi:integrase|nr:tyrosine-type recombinase/integrase [Faecalibacterium sp.]